MVKKSLFDATKLTDRSYKKPVLTKGSLVCIEYAQTATGVVHTLSLLQSEWYWYDTNLRQSALRGQAVEESIFPFSFSVGFGTTPDEFFLHFYSLARHVLSEYRKTSFSFMIL